MSTLPGVDLRALRDEEASPAQMFAILKQRRRTFFVVFGACMLAAALYCVLATRRYQAIGQIQVQKETLGSFGLDESVLGGADAPTSDALDYNVTLQTEARILQSDSLALQVIRELHLETTQDFFPPKKDQWGLPSWLFFWKKPLEPLTVGLDQAPDRRYAALKRFASHLKVEPITGTRLIEVRYSSPDPKLAAAVVNHLIAALMEYSYQSRFAATSQASQWLSAQLDDLRGQTERLQAKALMLERDTGVYGEDESHNIVLARLEALNQAWAEAESNRILKESIYRAASSGDPELISGLGGNAAAGSIPSMANSLGLLQNLRSQEATVRAELDQDRVRYGQNYPRIAELQAEWNSIQKAIQEEVHRIGERARTDYEIARRAEVDAHTAFERQKRLAGDLNDKAVAFALAKQEAEGSRQVYENLLAKLKEAGVLEGLRSTNITVVNPARVPSPAHPKSPNVLLCFAAALVMGLFSGSAAAFAEHAADHTIRSLESVEKMTGGPVLGLVPVPGCGPAMTKARASDQIMTIRYTDAPFAESLRMLRTTLMLSRSSNPPQVLLVTSPGAGEGKSTVSLELASVLAQQGARVLLAECDLRRPVLSGRTGVQSRSALSAALSNEGICPVPEPLPEMPNLDVLLGGPAPPFPAELLGSRRMQNLVQRWRNEYDFVVLDGPPLLPVADAAVLLRHCDAVLLLCRHGLTERRALKRGWDTLLRHAPAGMVMGAVLNAVPEGSSDFYEYYGYRSKGHGA
jgi:succinoglycan biosynthesis transport protein ExoP